MNNNDIEYWVLLILCTAVVLATVTAGVLHIRDRLFQAVADSMTYWIIEAVVE